jgi:hypothetical protein
MPDEAQIHRDLQLTDPLLEGNDIEALQFNTNKINDDKGGFWDTKKDGEYGHHTVHAVRLAAWAIGIGDEDLAPLQDHGTCSQQLQTWIRHPEERNDAQKERAEERKGELAMRIEEHHNIRSGILEVAKWGVAHEPTIHYEQSRPIDGINSPHKLPLSTDCSGFATLCYKWSGGPDPNGSGFNGFGFTGTILSACRHVPRSEAKPGDLVVFGAAPGTHVVVLVDGGNVGDPLCVSHGQEAGPIEVRLSVELSAHAGQLETFCSVL